MDKKHKPIPNTDSNAPAIVEFPVHMVKLYVHHLKPGFLLQHTYIAGRPGRVNPQFPKCFTRNVYATANESQCKWMQAVTDPHIKCQNNVYQQ